MSSFKHIAGPICLEFANTVSGVRRSEEEEMLRSYEDLLGWSASVGILSDAEVGPLRREARRRDSLAARTLSEAISLRDVIYRIFISVARDREPDPPDVATLNLAIAEALAHVCIKQSGSKFIWGWEESSDRLDVMLWRVARSAGDLLTSDDLVRVRECSSEECDWLFLDKSKNRRRRWCKMESCGNREKARRYRSKRATSKP